MTNVSAVEVRSEDIDLLLELQPFVVRVVRLAVGAGSQIAEDAAQEALIELQQALPRLRDREAAHAFAARIASRVAFRTVRRERRLAWFGLETPAADVELLVGSAVEPAERLALKTAFDLLPPRQRLTAVLRLYAGLSEEETAVALACSTGTVKRQLHDARKSLQSSLGDGVDSGDGRKDRR